MEKNIDEHFLFYWIATFWSSVAESVHICVQVFLWALVYAAELSEAEFGFSTENLELNKDTRCLKSCTNPGFKLSYQL